VVWASLTRSLIPRGHGVLVSGMVFDRRIGVAIQVGGDAGLLLLQRGEVFAASLAGCCGRYRRLPLEVKLLAINCSWRWKLTMLKSTSFLRLSNLGLHVAVAGLQRNEIISRISDLSLGAIQRQLKLQGIELEEDIGPWRPFDYRGPVPG